MRVPLAEHVGGAPSLFSPLHGPRAQVACPSRTTHCSPPRGQSRTPMTCSCQQLIARPSRSQMPTAPLFPRPSHAFIFAPRSAQLRSSEQEFARKPHSRIVSENFTALCAESSCDIEFTQAAMLAGIIAGGNGSLSHDVRSAHMCSTSSTSGGVTCPRPAAVMYEGTPPSGVTAMG